MLALLGGAGAGLLIASWGIRLLSALVDIGLAGFTLRAGLNWNVLAATALLSMATGVIFGLAPALQATRVDLVSALKETRGGGQGAGRRRWRFGGGLRRLLIVSQVAITLLLLVAAGLFGRTLNKLNSIQLGFNRDHLLLFNLNARQAGYKNEELGAVLPQNRSTRA